MISALAVFCVSGVVSAQGKADIASIVSKIAAVEPAFSAQVPAAVPVPAQPQMSFTVQSGEEVSLPADVDFFPIKQGRKLVYEYTTSESDGKDTVVVEFTGTSLSADGETATARVTVESKSAIKPVVFNVAKKAGGVFSYDFIGGENRKDFPFPLSIGAKWQSEAGDEQVVSFSSRIKVPAGNFYNCLKVSVALGGGDAGSASRFYAPGVGLVYENVSGEGVNSRLKLVSVQ